MAQVDQEMMNQVENILLSEIDSYKANMEQSEVDGSPQPEESHEAADSSGEPENASFRLEAAKRQQRKAEEKAAKAAELNQQLMERLAKLEGRLDERFGDSEQLDTEEEELPPSKLVEELRSLKDQLNSLKQDSQRKELKQRESIFLTNNPEAADVLPDLKDFILARKGVAQDLVSGVIDLEDAYTLYRRAYSKDSATSKTQDSSKVFGKSDAASPRGKVTDNSLAEAYKILDDKESFNKKDAVKVLEDEIARGIAQFL